METVRVQLRNAKFPMLSRNFGRSIIDRKLDEHNIGLPQYTGSESQHNTGIAQAMYLENVLPTAEGYRSVCYVPEKACQAVSTKDAKHVTSFEGEVLSSKDYISTAFVNGRRFSFNRSTKQLLKHEEGCLVSIKQLECVKLSEVLGITSRGNRLVAYSKDRIYWSNIEPNKELDFRPSLSTGAGSTKPNNLRGSIVAVLPILDELIVYTTHGALWMTLATRRAHNKFDLTPVPEVAGIAEPDHVAYGFNSGFHVAFTKSGLQVIKERRDSKFLDPQTSEFLAGTVMERYTGIQTKAASEDQSNKASCSDCTWASETQMRCKRLELGCPQLQEHVVAGSSLKKSLKLIGSKYLCISYGDEAHKSYEYTLVYDFALKRWGKLGIEHSGIFETEQGKIGMVSPNGDLLSLSTEHQESIQCRDRKVIKCEGVLILGRYQLERGSHSTLHAVEIERVHHESELSLYWLSSTDGANWTMDSVPCETVRVDTLRRYKLRKTGLSHAIKLVGTFDLNTVLISLDNNGSRK